MAREETVPTTALVGLQGQLDTVRSEIITTNTNLQSIGTLIRNDSLEDQRRLIEEREQEKNLLERKIRTGQEEALQQKVSSSLLPPVVKLENKLNSTFGKVSSALLGLFGFFGTKVIQGIQISAQLGLGALKGIVNILKGSFGFIANTLGTLGRGFTSILSGIGGITGKVIGALGSLAASPFKAIADLVGKLLPGIRAGAVAAGIGAGAATAGSLGINFLRTLGRFVSGAGAVQNAMEGDAIGAGVLGAAAVFPNPITTTAALAYTGAELLGYNPSEKISDMFGGITGGFGIKNPFSGKTLEAVTSSVTNFFNPSAGTQGQQGTQGTQGQQGTQGTQGQQGTQGTQGQQGTQGTQGQQGTSAVEQPGPVQSISIPVQPLVPPGPQPISTPQPITQSSPETPVIPPPSPEMVKQFEMAYANRDRPFARGRIESAWNNMTYEQQQQAKIWAKSTGKEKEWNKMKNEMKLIEKSPAATSAEATPVTPATSAAATPGTPLTPAATPAATSAGTPTPTSLAVVSYNGNIQPQPQQKPNLSNISEPPPDVVYLRSDQNQQAGAVSGNIPTLTDVPLIPSANPDNFYAVYAQLNYNVVL
jgi:hypothetical protein